MGINSKNIYVIIFTHTRTENTFYELTYANFNYF